MIARALHCLAPAKLNLFLHITGRRPAAHVQACIAGKGSLVDLVRADPLLGENGAALVAPGVGVKMRTSRGAAGPAAREEQVDSYRTMLTNEMIEIRSLAGVD